MGNLETIQTTKQSRTKKQSKQMLDYSDTPVKSTTTLLWVVNNFQKFPVCNEGLIKSPLFTAGNSTNGTWCIILKSNDEWLEPCIMFKTKGTCLDIEASIKVSIINAAFSQINERCAQHKFTSNESQLCFGEFIERDILLDPRKKLLCNGDLKICCQILIHDESEDQKDSDHDEHKISRLGRSLALLRENEYCCNFLIQVKDKQFQCHKFLLASRCEYFSALFKHQMEENDENKLVISDIEPSIFGKLLLYIYTGGVDVNEVDAYKLLLAADRFGLTRLKLLCEETLHSCLSLENSAAIFTFASVHDLALLKTNAYRILVDFVKKASTFQFLKAHEFSLESNLNSEASKTEGENAVVSTESSTNSVIQTKSLLPDKVHFWCKTEKPIVEKNELRIKNFRRIADTSRSKFRTLCSYNSTVGECTWSISACIQTTNYSDGDCKEFLVELDLISDMDEKVFPSTFCKFAVLTREHAEMCASTRKFDFPPRKNIQIFISSVDSILSTNEVFYGNDIILSCSISSWKSVMYESTPPTVPDCDLVKQMYSLLVHETFTDVVVSVQDQEFPCHKAILSCYSPYFASLFLEDKPEIVEIEIEDIELDVFKKIIFAMYTGNCKLTVPEILQLFSLEKKYWLFNTTCTFCEVFITALSAKNAVDILLFADDNNANNLKKTVIKFITLNLNKVINTPGWSKIAKRQELFLACVGAHIS